MLHLCGDFFKTIFKCSDCRLLPLYKSEARVRSYCISMISSVVLIVVAIFVLLLFFSEIPLFPFCYLRLLCQSSCICVFVANLKLSYFLLLSIKFSISPVIQDLFDFLLFLLWPAIFLLRFKTAAFIY